MKQVFLFIIFTFFTFTVNAQETTKEEVYFPIGRLHEVMAADLSYPKEARDKKISGDVVFNITIGADGSIVTVQEKSSPSSILTNAAVGLLAPYMEGKYQPDIVDGVAQEKTYYLVFRYRMYLNKDVENLGDQAFAYMKKKKYKKGVKTYTKAIKDDCYNADLYKMRSLGYKYLGKEELAAEDMQRYFDAKASVFDVITINLVGKTRSVRR